MQPNVTARERTEAKKCCGIQPCLSQSQLIRDICLSRHVLRAAHNRENYFLIDDAPHDTTSYRHAAYKQFISWAHGWLGAAVRSALPSCVCWKIRRTFPSADGNYKGFRFAN